VTQATYNSFRVQRNLPHRDVRQIEDSEVSAIYRQQYWDAVRADELPSGVAYCVFDAAVNSGPGRAVRWLQKMVGAKMDGIVGNETLSLAASIPPETIINKFCDYRLAFVRRLRHFDAFGRGWERRIREVRAQSVAWATNAVIPESTVEAPGKADGPEKTSATLKDMVRDPTSMTTITGVLGSAGALTSGSGPIQWAVAAVLVIAALTGVWWLVRGRQET
jgi:lysozyme family protein